MPSKVQFQTMHELIERDGLPSTLRLIAKICDSRAATAPSDIRADQWGRARREVEQLARHPAIRDLTLA